jgi:hypothetical protein
MKRAALALAPALPPTTLHEDWLDSPMPDPPRIFALPDLPPALPATAPHEVWLDPLMPDLARISASAEPSDLIARWVSLRGNP